MMSLTDDVASGRVWSMGFRRCAGGSPLANSLRAQHQKCVGWARPEPTPSGCSGRRYGSSRGRGRGQALIEYLLMTLMLLFIFTTLYRMLSGQMKRLFTNAGVAILTSYY